VKHFSEDELIAYQLHESTNEAAIRAHLEACSACADLSEAIAETLRIFSAETAPQPDLELNWQRLRGNLSVLSAERPRRFAWLRSGWMWPAAGFATALILLVSGVGVHLHREVVHKPNFAINGHGPLTTQPTDPAIADHLDAAERLLTEVNNAPGTLDEATRTQAHDLLMKNAVFVHNARQSGDVAQAAVLENLGRVLTTVDNEPPTPHSTLRLRLEMNTSGLLLDIRILRQNDGQNNDGSKGAIE
jgi:predicted anti-sigma-YlaC factor YlaD